MVLVLLKENHNFMNYNIVKNSFYRNTYGGLDLIKGENDKFYLKMQDCFGPDFFGPLTDEQINAFYILCEVKPLFNPFSENN